MTSISIGATTMLSLSVRTDTQRVGDDLASYHEDTRRVVSEVLDQPEFRDLNRNAYAWWTSFLEWVEWFFRGISGFFDGLPSWLWWTLVVWMILTLVAILAHFAYVLVGLIGSASSRRTTRVDEKSGRGELFGIRDLEFDSVYARACELLAAGNWADATKFVYVAAILWLDRQGLIRFKSSKTNHDYLGELAHEPDCRTKLGELTQRFEITVYGGQPSTAENCNRMSALLEVLLRESHPVVSH